MMLEENEKGDVVERIVTIPENNDNDKETQQIEDKEQKSKANEQEAIKEFLEEYAVENRTATTDKINLRKIIRGDFLSSNVLRQQVGLFFLITLLMVVYIGFRYSCQQKLIEIDKLSLELKDAKYKALYSTSELTEISRESNVLEMLKKNNDTTIKIASEPPYIIEVPNE